MTLEQDSRNKVRRGWSDQGEYHALLAAELVVHHFLLLLALGCWLRILLKSVNERKIRYDLSDPNQGIRTVSSIQRRYVKVWKVQCGGSLFTPCHSPEQTNTGALTCPAVSTEDKVVYYSIS